MTADLQAREAVIRERGGTPRRYRTRWGTEAVMDISRIGRRATGRRDATAKDAEHLRVELAVAIAQRDAVLATLAALLPERLNKLMTPRHAATLMDACTHAARTGRVGQSAGVGPPRGSRPGTPSPAPAGTHHGAEGAYQAEADRLPGEFNRSM